MQLNRTTQILCTIALLAAVVWLGTSTRFYTEALISAFFGFALASVLIIHVRVRPSVIDSIAVLGSTALLAVVDFRIFHSKPAIMAWLSFAGLSSLFILGLRTVWAKAADRKLLQVAFVSACLFVVSEYYADIFPHWTSTLHPKVFDLYLYSFDASLKVQIPFLVGQSFATWPGLRVTSLLFYMALAIPIAMVYVGRLLRFGEKAIPSFLAFLAMGPIGVVFYNMLPALGPAHLFGNHFPWSPLTVSQASRIFLEPVALAGAPNAIPSLHMAWVLLVWWYSRALSWWERSVAFFFLFFTVLATLGTGEHYLIDLVVAFPFAVFVEALFAFTQPLWSRRRVFALGFGLITTLAWIAGLRYGTHFFWLTTLLPWALCILTVVLSVVTEARLQIATVEKPNNAIAETPIAQPAI
jgi:hypothetical protein